MKKVAISQSNYIPWKGYFDMINSVDEFIIYDDMQFTKRDWRNRNMIKTPNGLHWLTIPVKVKGKFHQKINETEIEGTDWAMKHWKTISMNYAQCPFYKKYAPALEALFSDLGKEVFLSQVNYRLLKHICEVLGINTSIRQSSEFELIEGKTERLLDLCLKVNGTDYISGPAAKDYIDPVLFQNAGVGLWWMNYADYPAYPQKFGEFAHGVSVLDLIFNVGEDFRYYMKSFRGDVLHVR